MQSSLSYDALPYPDLSHSQTHPRQLAALAMFLGLKPTPVTQAQILELGCASGVNLIAIAQTLPGAACVGIDKSARQIEAGRAIVQQLGLSNVTLHALDFLEVPESLGIFDFIIAHGIYSWIPEPVQDQLLALCQRHLAPQGIAYVSYNTYPGWHFLQASREMMRYGTRNLTDGHLMAEHARRLLAFIADSVSITVGNQRHDQFLSAYTSFMKYQAAYVAEKPDSLLLHDEMEENNIPVYFYQFVEHAAAHGLQYLVEAHFPSVILTSFPQAIVEGVAQRSQSVIDVEQYMDFIRARSFRQTLLCHQAISLSRLLNHAQLAGLYLTSDAAIPHDNTPETWRLMLTDGTVYQNADPLVQAAFEVLLAAAPLAVRFEDLVESAWSCVSDPPSLAEAARRIGAPLAEAFSHSTNLLNLHAVQIPAAATISEYPMVSRLALLQLDQGVITNQRHERVELDDLAKFLLPLLDGTHDRAALLAAVEPHIEGNAAAAVDDTLEFFRRHAVLIR